LALALTVVSPRAEEQKPKAITGEIVSAVRSWVEAVRTHSPGRADAAVVAIAALSHEARERLDAGMMLFLRALLGAAYTTGGNTAARSVVDLGHAAGNPDANAFLKQAATLHADVAAYGDRFPVRPTGGATAAPSRIEELRIGRGSGFTRLERNEPVSPLLTSNRILLNQDGEIVGETVASWNWPFARFLLDLIDAVNVETVMTRRARPKPTTDPFIGAWYHASTAYMFASGTYGDLTPHLQHAGDVLPDNALTLFDRGCYAELLGLPMHQALTSDDDVIARRLESASAAPTWVTPGSQPSSRIPAAEKTNGEAERLYRRSLAVDPLLIEVRVRLARLLDLRGRDEEAAAELETALSGEPIGEVAFYAHLIAGRVAQDLGRFDEASHHYHSALGQFPDAQSPLLASSQLALRKSDVSATLAPIARLGDRSAVFTADPWWQYHLCAGRDADDLLRALWASVPRP
jgi:hypothetical protein